MTLKGNRKLAVVLAIEVLGTLLCAAGKLDGAQWREVSVAALGFFVAGNWAEHREAAQRGGAAHADNAGGRSG